MIRWKPRSWKLHWSPPKKQTPLQRALTSQWQFTKNALKKLLEPRTQAIYASKIKETGLVQPEKAFKPAWKKLRVTIHDKTLLTPFMPRVGSPTSNVVTLDTYLKFPKLHQNVSLFMTGKPRMGKTELCKLICLLLAFKYQLGDPYFLMSPILDALRDVQKLMHPGVPVYLDDIGGDIDDPQLIYSTVSMWKGILQVKDQSQVRARNEDIMFAERQPKVVSSNCKNLAHWIATMFPKSEPEHTDAIPPRVAECEAIEESLYSGSIAQAGSEHFLPEERSNAEAEAAVRDMFD